MGILDRLFGKKDKVNTNPYPNPFTNKVTGILNRLGMKYKVEEEDVINLILCFEEDDGSERSQLVVIASTGNDGQFVTISSPVGLIEEMGEQFNVAFMNELLVENTTSIGFGFAVESLGDQEYLITCSDQVLETLDDSELDNAMSNCAIAADEMEKKLGLGDKF